MWVKLQIIAVFSVCRLQPNQISMDENILVSRYINNPLLIDGKLFSITYHWFVSIVLTILLIINVCFFPQNLSLTCGCTCWWHHTIRSSSMCMRRAWRGELCVGCFSFRDVGIMIFWHYTDRLFGKNKYWHLTSNVQYKLEGSKECITPLKPWMWRVFWKKYPDWE